MVCCLAGPHAVGYEATAAATGKGDRVINIFLYIKSFKPRVRGIC